jgi:hypothetical protein
MMKKTRRKIDAARKAKIAIEALREQALKGYANGLEAKIGIGQWISFYNKKRFHEGVDKAHGMSCKRSGPEICVMRNSTAPTPARESAQSDFPHSLQYVQIAG